MNSKIISIIIILALVVVGIMLFRNTGEAPTGLDGIQEGVEIEIDMTDSSDTDEVADESEVSTVREFVVDAGNFSFTPNVIRVNEGDTVRITVRSTGGVHDLMIDEFSVATKTLSAGQEETIQFVANKTGEFEYYCSIGSHRAMGMVGKLIVE